MIEKNLWRESQRHRGLLMASTICGILSAAVILWQALTLANLINAVFMERASLAQLLPQIVQFFLLITLRLALQVSSETCSLLLGQAVQHHLRKAMLQKIDCMGPVALRQEEKGRLLYLLNEGIGTLESYFSNYLPQLFQSLVIPLLFLCVIFPRDVMSGVILLVTTPLVPFFMVLIGKWTNKVNARQWHIINQLSGYLHDVMAGLTTLKLMNRSSEQGRKIEQVGGDYASATLSVLRWAFLSSLALELLTTISIALVSVGLGLRLVEGQLDFATAFFILLIAPEFYQPLRALGSHFHTSLNTREAAADFFAFLNRPVVAAAVTVDPKQQAALALQQVTAVYPDQSVPALKDLSLSVQPGEIVALVGSSGSGKTTILNVLQGFLTPQQGTVSVQEQPAVIQQKPYLFTGTIWDNLRFGNEAISDEELLAICERTGLLTLLQRLPDGLQTRVTQGGAGLSGGQRQMIAMVRAICQQKSIILFDEATANLDLATEQQLNQSLQQLLQQRTVLLVAHRLSTVQMADRIVVVHQGQIVEQGTQVQLLQQRGYYWQLVQRGLEQ